MIPSSTTNKKTPGTQNPLNTDGGVLESSSGGVLHSPIFTTTQTEVSSILADVSVED